MLIALILLGVFLIGFGAFVLLRHSDRPGGTIKWLGAEVTSTGAGLPIVVLGVGIIGFGIWNDNQQLRPADRSHVEDRSPVTDTAPLTAPARAGDGSCMAAWLGGVPRDRIQSVEVGMRDLEVIGSHQRLDLPFVLLLTENGERIGALRLRLYRASNSSANVFKVEDAVDVACVNVEDIRNATRGGNPRELVNWDTLRQTLGAHEYELRIGGEGNVSVNFQRVQ